MFINLTHFAVEVAGTLYPPAARPLVLGVCDPLTIRPGDVNRFDDNLMRRS